MVLNKSHENIKLESAEYERLNLNEKIAVFNREVHAFEDQQQQEIIIIWEKINKEYIYPEKLPALRTERIKNGLAQASVNLKKMLAAKTLYEAELYRRSYIKALELVKTPRRRFIMLQSQSLGLAHDAKDVTAKITAVEQELLNLKTLYSANEQQIFTDAHRALTEMMQIKEPQLFAAKRTQFLERLADIHERVHQHTKTEKDCEEDIEQTITRGQAIFNARSMYLEDKNHWMNRANDIAEKSWVTTGAGLGVVSVLAVVGAVVMAPVAALGFGIVGAAYGVVDMARTVGSTVTEATTTKLGEREVIKPQQSWKDKAKSFAQKALPIALCVAGVVLAVAAIVATGGAAAIVLAVAGIAVTAVGVGKMAYDKYQEQQEILEIQQQHKEINESFEQKAEELLQKSPMEKSHTDSMQEEMQLLAGHKLTPADIVNMKDAATMESQEQDAKIDLGKKELNKNNLPVSEKEKEDENEGEGEGGGSNDASKDDSHVPTLRP